MVHLPLCVCAPTCSSRQLTTRGAWPPERGKCPRGASLLAVLRKSRGVPVLPLDEGALPEFGGAARALTKHPTLLRTSNHPSIGAKGLAPPAPNLTTPNLQGYSLPVCGARHIRPPVSVQAISNRVTATFVSFVPGLPAFAPAPEFKQFPATQATPRHLPSSGPRQSPIFTGTPPRPLSCYSPRVTHRSHRTLPLWSLLVGTAPCLAPPLLALPRRERLCSPCTSSPSPSVGERSSIHFYPCLTYKPCRPTAVLASSLRCRLLAVQHPPPFRHTPHERAYARQRAPTESSIGTIHTLRTSCCRPCLSPLPSPHPPPAALPLPAPPSLDPLTSPRLASRGPSSSLPLLSPTLPKCIGALPLIPAHPRSWG